MLKKITTRYAILTLVFGICLGCKQKPVVQPLRRGVNLSHWFSQTRLPDYPPQPVTKDDFILLRSMGVDHVRLPIDPVRLWDFPGKGPLKSGYLSQIDEAIRLALEQGFVAVVDMHPRPDFKKQLEASPEFLNSFADFWEALAEHLSQYDSRKLAMEILNEPEIEDAAKWQALAGRLHGVIRQAAPDHTIIVGGCQWSNVETLHRLVPLADPNVIYTFHFYEPHAFTHQGTRWGSPGWLKLRNVPYPLSKEQCAKLLERIQDNKARYALKDYLEQDWNRGRIEARAAEAAKWAEQHNATLWCGEFGVYLPYAPSDSRARYLGDVRTALEKHGIGWSLWNHQGSFGFVIKENPGELGKVDLPVAKALGLNAPVHP